MADGPPYPALKEDFATEIATRVAALINSKPSSPTTPEIQAAILDEIGTHWTIHVGYNWAHEKEQRTSALMRELWDAVIAEWEERAEHPNFAPIARLAKQLARQHHDEHDIYHVTSGIAGGQPCRCAKNTVSLCFPLQPQWALYVEDARHALEAIAELEGKTDTARPQ